MRDNRRARQHTGVDPVVMNKVWGDASRLVEGLRGELEQLVSAPSVPLDVQERCVQYVGP